MRKFPIAALFCTILLDMLGVGILIPVLPQLFANPLSPHYLLGPDATLAQGYRLLGLLLATFSIGQFLASPIFGQLSDKLGRKRVLAWSISATAFGYALFAVGLSLGDISVLFFARALSGLMSGNFVIAQAAIGDLSRPEDRAKNFGLVGVAFGIGFIVGPFLGGILADPNILPWFSASTPFWFASFLAFLNVLFVIKVLPETHVSPRRDVAIVFNKALHHVFHAWNLTNLRPLFIVNFLFMFGFAFYTSFSAVYLTYRFHFTAGDIGTYFAFVGLCIVLTQGLVTRFVSKRASEEKVLTKSLLFIGVFIATILVMPSSGYLYLNAPFFSIAVGLSMANLSAFVSKRAGPERQGEVMGLNGSVTALAGIFPMLASGFIAAALSPEVPLLLASLVTISAGVYFNLYVARPQAT